MLDIRFIRDNAERVQEAARQKGYAHVDIQKLLELDDNRRALQQQVDALRTRRNEIAAKMKGGRPEQALMDEGKQIKVELAEREEYLRTAEAETLELLKKVPNMPLDFVPVGASEDENVVTKTVGEPPKFAFEPKNHEQIAVAKGWMDKERAAKVAGSRFAYIKGDMMLLEWAVKTFVLNELSNVEVIRKLIEDNGLNIRPTAFIPVDPPYVAKTDVYEATGRLNKEETTYKLADDDLWLNASAEHVLAPMYLNETLPEVDLPIRYLGYTAAFRREAGTYGKDMEGILRMHQFNKLEMETFSTPETSLDENKLMVAVQEHIMQSLGLPYHVVQKCTADIGGPNANGIDIDVWLPSQDKYRETHTADLITDYQTRRMNTRVKRGDGSIVLAHTNDATALSQRPIIAIIENNQTAEGDVIVPEVLRPYLGGREKL
jgi:seryl-tRNA synthetase